jgi:hypothetical protein
VAENPVIDAKTASNGSIKSVGTMGKYIEEPHAIKIGCIVSK